MIKIKVAVISDIHANILALEEILKDCRKENVDKYIFSGDLINDLPFGNEVLNIIRQISDCVVRGNKEEYITEYDEKKFNWTNIQFQNTIFMYNHLSKDNLEYVKKLPLTTTLEEDGVSMLVCHGSPETVEELIHENSSDKIEKYSKNLKEDMLIFGHTHDKIWYEIHNNKILLNAGCAGVSPYNMDNAEYAILDINSGVVDIQKRQVKFDIEKLKNMIKKTGILDVDEVLMNLTYGAICGKGEVRHAFFTEAMAKMKNAGKKLYKEDATGIYKYFKLYDDDIWINSYNNYKNQLDMFK